MTTQTLIPEPDAWGSADPLSAEEPGSVSRTTREFSGDIVREPTLTSLNVSDSETDSLDRGGETTSLGKPHLASPLIRLPSGTLPKERILVLQQWEGVVTDVTDDSFFAELQDPSNASEPLEVVEILIEEVPEDDRSLLVEGAVFYWCIAHETSRGGQLRRMSEIRLRRTSRWSRRALQRAAKRAEELFELHNQQ